MDITVYIELNPQVRFGKVVVKGTRTTVAEVLANGMGAADIEEDFPAIRAAQVRACLLHAKYGVAAAAPDAPAIS